MSGMIFEMQIVKRSVLIESKVCGIFEGDETAVSHHVAKAHFE